MVRIPRARVLEKCPQLHLIARQVGIAVGQGHEGTGGSHHPTPQPQPYQEKKHWRVLITHCSFTRDPPQKCTPALWGQGVRSGGTLSTWQRTWDTPSPVADADSPGRVARLATNDAPLLLQPLLPLATLLKCHCVCGQGGHQLGLYHQHPPQLMPTQDPWAATCILHDGGHRAASCREKTEGSSGTGSSHPEGTKTTICGLGPL